jgi:pimeloyl-ACP methyl ester carboxylesterase
MISALSGALAVSAVARPAAAAQAVPAGSLDRTFKERFFTRKDGHRLYAREWAGSGPTMILLHGFPDNLHIYDELAPLLAAGGRHVVAFDFLGFGASDKPAGFAYNFDEQVADLSTVVAALGTAPVTPVVHDAGGPAGINFALSNPARIASLGILNTFYANAPTLRFPELIQLNADPDLKALAGAILADPEKLKWLLTFQNQHFEINASPTLKHRFDTILQPIINANFAAKPGAGPAFVAMTGDARANVAANGSRLGELRRFGPKVSLVWGMGDPYLNKGVAEDLASHCLHARIFPMDAGHWPQIDYPDQVAKLLLANT